jgi:uncharacterized protein YkwD
VTSAAPRALTAVLCALCTAILPPPAGADVHTWTGAGPLSPTEGQVALLTNEVRVHGTLGGRRAPLTGTCAEHAPPAPPVEPSGVLTRMARSHATYSAATFTPAGPFNAHREPQSAHPAYYGDTLLDRAVRAWADAGGTFTGRVAENVALNYPAPLDVVAAWLRSPSHCEALIDPAHTHLGVGLSVTAGVAVTVQVFSTPARPGAPSPPPGPH